LSFVILVSSLVIGIWSFRFAFAEPLPRMIANPSPQIPEPDRETQYAPLRRLMVEQQIRQRGLSDARVLAAMARVPREEFVPADLRDHAYDDSALSISHGQTISQPYTVAFMVDALELQGNEKVLEIGTGCGYGAAVLSLVSREVHSIERITELGLESRKRLHRLGYHNVTVHLGDGSLGLPSHAPFDAIVATAGGPELPAPFVEQLAPGGRIVMPIGDSRSSQRMKRFTSTPNGMMVEELGAFAFVPLIGQHAWQGE
jgi:protein-L-isoaspartate(D-aspartate) O-methyltransferase